MTSVESNLRYSSDRSRIFGSSYKYYRLLPTNPANASLTLGAAPIDIQWQNLTSIFNPSHSSLEMDVVFAAAGGNDRVTVVWADAVPFTRVRFIGTNEFVLMDLPYADLYSKVVGKASTPLSEYLNRGPGPAAATTAALAHTFNWCCQRANVGVPGSYQSSAVLETATTTAELTFNFFQLNASLASVIAAKKDVLGTTSQSVLTDQYVANAAADGAATATNVATAISPYDIDYGNTSSLCQQAVIISAVPAQGAAGVALTVKYRIPLRRFADSILSMNKNLFFGQSGPRLEITLAPLNKWCYYATAAPVVNIVTGAAAFASAVSVSNLCLNLAVEQNSLAKKYVLDQFNSGQLKFLVPYAVVQQVSLGNTATAATVQQFLNAGFGRNLLRSYLAVYHGTDSDATCRNTDNVNGHHITQLQSQINTYQLQDRMINCNSGDVTSPDSDWSYLSRLLRDSAYADGCRDYKKYWLWIDNHSGSDSLIDEQKVADKDAGFPLAAESISYYIQMTKRGWAANTMNAVVYSIVQKLIQISPNGTMELR